MKILLKVLAIAATVSGLTTVQAAIVAVSVPTGTQGSLSRAFVDGVYSTSAVNGTIDLNIGIGIILKPTWLSVGWIAPGDPIDYALHQNGS